jgi:hypothetical protein
VLFIAAVVIAIAQGTSNSANDNQPTAQDAGPVEACKELPPAQAIETVVAPGPEVSKEKARFSGAWEGMAGSDFAGLVVTNVTETDATSFYVFGTLRGRLVSQFRPDGSLHQGGNQQITFTWSFGASPNVLQVLRLEGNNRVEYTMKRCTLQP